MNASDVPLELDVEELCDLPFSLEKSDNLRRGSMEHVKGRVGSFWGQSAISQRSRMISIYSRGDSGVYDDVNNSRQKDTTPREDDSFLDF